MEYNYFFLLHCYFTVVELSKVSEYLSFKLHFFSFAFLQVRDGKQSQPSPLHTTELKEFFSHVFKLETTHRTKAKQLLNHQEFATGQLIKCICFVVQPK